MHNLPAPDLVVVEVYVVKEFVGLAKDNIWIERFWKTIKYEYIHILPEENGAALYSGLKRFIDNYNYPSIPQTAKSFCVKV